jgi:biopolymer transport protein ExbD
MNFRRGATPDEPEINFIPLIDVLLVILIFLMVSTTFSKFTELQVNLPTAGAEGQAERPNELVIGVGVDSQYLIGQDVVSFKDSANFAKLLQQAAKDLKDPIIIIHADAGATHQAVVNVLEAARLAGLPRISYATQSGSK